jgi:hypothetical protein
VNVVVRKIQLHDRTPVPHPRSLSIRNGEVSRGQRASGYYPGTAHDWRQRHTGTRGRLAEGAWLGPVCCARNFASAQPLTQYPLYRRAHYMRGRSLSKNRKSRSPLRGLSRRCPPSNPQSSLAPATDPPASTHSHSDATIRARQTQKTTHFDWPHLFQPEHQPCSRIAPSRGQ